jgi:hypothetical protein
MPSMSKAKNVGALVSLLGVMAGCSIAASEPPAVLSVGARNLRCQRSELETALHRESSQVREYYVGCDFMYTRVLCADSGCYPAKPRPPCFAGGCFKEDPVTFEWQLDETLANADVPDASQLFR